MKKKQENYLIMIVMFLTIILFSSCENEINKETASDETVILTYSFSTFDVSVKRNMLVFEDPNNYQSAIDYLACIGDANFFEFENRINYNSMRKIFSELNKELPVDDELLAVLLNDEANIQIGEYIFHLDFENKTVDAKLVTSNQVLKSTLSYSMEDDIIDLVFNEEEVLNELKGADSYCDGAKLGYYYWSTVNGDVKYKIVYQRAGIYYSLQAKIKKDGWTQGAVYISLSTSSTPGETTFYRNNVGCWDFASNSTGGYGHEYNIRPYSKSRRLSAYRYFINFYGRDDNTSPPGGLSQPLVIKCQENNDCP